MRTSAIARTYPEAKEEKEGEGVRAEPPIEVTVPLFVHYGSSAWIPVRYCRWAQEMRLNRASTAVQDVSYVYKYLLDEATSLHSSSSLVDASRVSQAQPRAVRNGRFWAITERIRRNETNLFRLLPIGE